MAFFSSYSDKDLEKQIARLFGELALLKKQLSSRGHETYEEGRETLADYRDAVSAYYDELSGKLNDHLPELRKKARLIENRAREHPAAVVTAGLIIVGLAASLFFSRR